MFQLNRNTFSFVVAGAVLIVVSTQRLRHLALQRILKHHLSSRPDDLREIHLQPAIALMGREFFFISVSATENPTRTGRGSCRRWWPEE